MLSVCLCAWMLTKMAQIIAAAYRDLRAQTRLINLIAHQQLGRSHLIYTGENCRLEKVGVNRHFQANWASQSMGRFLVFMCWYQLVKTLAVSVCRRSRHRQFSTDVKLVGCSMMWSTVVSGADTERRGCWRYWSEVSLRPSPAWSRPSLSSSPAARSISGQYIATVSIVSTLK